MNQNVFRNMLVVGVEDGSFQKGIARKALLLAVFLRRIKIESIRIAEITVDGLDATEKLIQLLGKWEFDVLLLGGVSFAGFNLVDPTLIYERFGNPVVVISRARPNNKAVKQALQRHFDDWELRWKVFERLGSVHRIVVLVDEPPVYVETVGIGVNWTCNLVRALSICSRIPEPLRVARLIARGLS